MPELPEVQTTVSGLKKVLPKLKITDVWTDLAVTTPSRKDFYDTIKSRAFFENFKNKTIGQKVVSVERRAKNILINLSNGQTIIIHMKMTGHLLFGLYDYNPKEKIWYPHVKEKNDALRDPYNRFIHVVFEFSNKKHLAFSDSRKFGKVTIVDSKTAHETNHLKNLGPEPLHTDFTEKVFKDRLSKRPNWEIKTALMSQDLISGIGNIYSDELLWLSSVHPKSKVSKIPAPIFKKMFPAMKTVLQKGIDFGGDSMSDYRRIDGTRGEFQNKHNVYQKKGDPCGKKDCHGKIERTVVGGRSSHFCPIHQKLYV